MGAHGGKTLSQVFEEKVIKAEGCWGWTGVHNARGYGHIGRNGTTVKAHRAAYELYVGPIPAGLQLDHLCRNKGCVNPAHLEPVTGAENCRRAMTVVIHPGETQDGADACAICGIPAIRAHGRRLKAGRCESCYKYWMRHGKTEERAQHLGTWGLNPQ